jgi:hypothetical protein
MRRARLLAFFLDWLLCAGLADIAGLALTGLLYRWFPLWWPAIPWIWSAAAAAAIGGFLLRDAAGGRARRWLALEAVDSQGRPPGVWGSVRRNLPLLVPGWNIVEAWPVFRRGDALRPSDRKSGIRIVTET